MAKRRAKKHVADKKLIVEAFTEMAKSKNIDKDLLQGIVEDTLSMIVRKKYGTEANFDIIVNMEKGDVEIYLMREIVDEITDPILQIAMVEAQKYSDEELEVGDEFIEEITLDNISDSFGRRLVSLASQNMNQKIREIEKDNIYKEYVQKVGEIIVGEIYQIRRNDILVTHNKVEMRLPREEQIPNEPFRYKKAQSIKTLVKEVRNTAGGSQPEIILSRAADSFLAKLFEIEIPEIYDGIIAIKSIAREPGERAKVAVQSYDDRVDPVGACVGMKGIRIHSIVRELNNENIDLIEYSEDPREFIMRALAPAKIKDIQLNEEVKSATVTVPDDQVSLAIGKNGQNVRLASRLTGYSLSLVKEGGEDIDLSEFKNELGNDIYNALMDNGVETAREFLNAEISDLMSLPEMSKELLIELRSIILIEFDEKESPEIIDEIMKYGFDDVEEKTENEENTEINTIDVSEAAKESIDENIDENADNIGNN
ncbi:MAG: transcription termination factor NusA [Candidatus Kapaibacteriota bacterium]